MRPISGAFATVLLASHLLLPGSLVAQQASGPPPGRNLSDMTFALTPGFPTCSQASVQSGDPTTGPSILLGKLAAGCVIPWHWHSPNEHLMLVSGTARVEPKDGAPVTLQPGGFARMDSRHVHRFTCLTACALFVYSDAALDMHYVDSTGKELAPEQALKAVNETAAKPST
jgi:quercetin dioxygenase-like cupin family protein